MHIYIGVCKSEEIHHLSNTLLRAEAKAKALQEELENPMNVHRWREIEGSDPATYDAIQKVKAFCAYIYKENKYIYIFIIHMI